MIVVQVNGKMRAEVLMDRDASKEAILACAKANERVAAHLSGKTLVKEIYVPGKIVNLVVK
jgi:leucyl-tRNA synthetase